MRHEDRRAAAAAYKERKVAAGVFTLRCAATGACWAGAAPDLATIWNRLSFTLRRGAEAAAGQGTGTDAQRRLQAAWRAHGPESFSFAVVERVDEAVLAYGRDRALRQRRDHWCTALPADPI